MLPGLDVTHTSALSTIASIALRLLIPHVIYRPSVAPKLPVRAPTQTLLSSPVAPADIPR